MKPTIAIYTDWFLPYSQTFVYRQLLAATEKYDVIVLTQRKSNQDLFPFERLVVCKLPFIKKLIYKLFGYLNPIYTSTPPSQLACFKRELLKHNVQLIHAHFGPYALRILPIAKELGIPLIVTFHGFDASRLLKNSKYIRELPELFEYAKVLVVSDLMKKRLSSLHVHQNHVTTHYIGVPLEDFPFQERVPILSKVRNNETIYFLQVSSFVAKKGHQYTVEAFAKYLEYYPNSHLTFAGDGDELAYIKTLCKSSNIENKVEFLGKVTPQKVSKLMSQADVFLHHSITTEDSEQEGIPISILEAMSSGLIVVSTYHSGIPEVIQDGINGYLVPERDIDVYVEKLKEAIHTEGPLGVNAANLIESKFNMTIQNKHLLNIYSEYLSQY